MSGVNTHRRHLIPPLLNDMVAIEDYEGREQSYVKHVFLERYLERLAHKTGSKFPHIVFVDGFAGPWQSANEAFQDTSFGIALNALRNAKASWKKIGRAIRIGAHLVERDSQAYARLATVATRYPDIEVKTHPGDFVAALPGILSDIPADAFVFFLIDPKGWRIPLRALLPMLARRNSEVIFNFMFDFINRAASIKEPIVVAGLDELIPFGDWRSRLEEAERRGATPEVRKEILVAAFTESLAKIGAYAYVAETTILRPLKNRPLYCLCYATRHPTGIEVFRDCQVKALEEQSKTRATSKVRHAQAVSGQHEIFQSLHDMGPDELAAFLGGERRSAEVTLLALVPAAPDAVRYGEVWPKVLARHVVRRTDINQIGARLRAENRLIFPDWERGKRVPQPHYRMQHPLTSR